MAENTVERKLRAILCADVKGYSRMMGEDEVGTYQTLTANLESIRSIISEHKGRVFSSPGDAVMAEFSSVVNAVQCAVKIQEKIEETNSEAPEDQKMQFRIGVNLGDVIHDGEQVYGDGVNIAARIETLAEPGEVSISRNVYSQVRNKLKFGYEYQGEHQVKNITNPVQVYKILTEPEHAGKLIGEKPKSSARKWIWPRTATVIVLLAITGWLVYQKVIAPKFEPASVEKMAYPLPVEPSIAVLPFDNMSGDPDQEYLSDGITENIIAVLTNIRDMVVIARNSTFAYKGKAVKIQQVAEELGVRYVLEGSIQKTEDRVRITAQLIDAISGKHLWAERYDRNLKDLFALQDEITMKIVTVLRVKLTEGEKMLGVDTNNLDAHLKYLQSRKQIQRKTKEGNAQGQKLIEEAIALDPEYASAYLILSATHLMDIQYGLSDSPKQSLKTAEELVRKAISLSGENADARAFLGRIYLTKRQYNEAITEGKHAVEMAPNSAFVHAALAYTLKNAGRPEEAIIFYKKAIRLSPISDSWYASDLGNCYGMLGRYEDAISAYKKAINISPESPYYHAGLAAIYFLTGREGEARAEITEAIKIDPKFSLESYGKGALYKNPEYLYRLIDALRKAGLPD